MIATLLTALAAASPSPMDLQDTELRAVTVEPDLRRCAWPLCGGWHYTDLDRATMACSDGRIQPTCYAAELDFGPMGLTSSEIDALLALDDLETVVYDVRVVRFYTKDLGRLDRLAVYRYRVE